ncbi:hypothetical protein SK128_022201, partial [Halocaridina rubra]
LPDVLVSKADLQAAPFKKMVGCPMKIHLKDDTIPFVIHVPWPITFAIQIQVKEEFDMMVTRDNRACR